MLNLYYYVHTTYNCVYKSGHFFLQQQRATTTTTHLHFLQNYYIIHEKTYIYESIIRNTYLYSPHHHHLNCYYYYIIIMSTSSSSSELTTRFLKVENECNNLTRNATIQNTVLILKETRLSSCLLQ